MKRALAFSVLALGACATNGEVDAIPERGAGNCDAAATQKFIGELATTQIGADVMAVTAADRLRWITPGTLVTADYRTDRVNVHLDDTNRVERIACG